MKIVVLTSNSLRHKFIANRISKHSQNMLVISECKEHDSNLAKKFENEIIQDHFNKRFVTEQKFFSGNTYFHSDTIPILYKELSLRHIANTILDFSPDIGVVFGSSILKDELINCFPKNRLINLHLGLSPYYRGAGTNFWPFVNDELEFAGSTLLHLDSGIDTGNIISHIRPDFTSNDNVHTIGCKIIQKSMNALDHVIDMIENNQKVSSVKQWEVENSKYYKQNDFTENSLKKYYENLENKIVDNYIASPKSPNLIELDETFCKYT